MPPPLDYTGLVRIVALATVALAASVAVVSAGAWQQQSRTGTVASVAIDLKATRQVIQGFGSSERVWSDPHLADDPRVNVPVAAQAKILRLLYGTIGLTRVRSVLDQGVEKQPGGPFDFKGKLADDHVAYVKQAQRYGLRTFFPGPVYLEPWMTAGDPGATVDWAMAMLRRWRALGLEPKLYAPLNEPKIAGDFPPDWMRQVVLQLGRKLKAEGFATKLVIPDDENPTDALLRAEAVLSDPEARGYVAALAYHVYKWNEKDARRIRALATRYRLPVWMTEYSSPTYTDWRSSLDWAAKLDTLLTVAEVNAVDYLWGFFGEKYGTDAMVSIHFQDGVYRGHSLTARGSITAQYARFVRPGFVRIAVASPSEAVRISAYRGSGRLVVVATNLGGSAQAVRFQVKRGTVGGLVGRTRSSETETLRRLSGVAARRNTFGASLPPMSLTTFVVRSSPNSR